MRGKRGEEEGEGLDGCFEEHASGELEETGVEEEEVVMRKETGDAERGMDGERETRCKGSGGTVVIRHGVRRVGDPEMHWDLR